MSFRPITMRKAKICDLEQVTEGSKVTTLTHLIDNVRDPAYLRRMRSMFSGEIMVLDGGKPVLVSMQHGEGKTKLVIDTAPSLQEKKVWIATVPLKEAVRE